MCSSRTFSCHQYTYCRCCSACFNCRSYRPAPAPPAASAAGLHAAAFGLLRLLYPHCSLCFPPDTSAAPALLLPLLLIILPSLLRHPLVPSVLVLPLLASALHYQFWPLQYTSSAPPATSHATLSALSVGAVILDSTAICFVVTGRSWLTICCRFHRNTSFLLFWSALLLPLLLLPLPSASLELKLDHVLLQLPRLQLPNAIPSCPHVCFHCQGCCSCCSHFCHLLE